MWIHLWLEDVGALIDGEHKWTGVWRMWMQWWVEDINTLIAGRYKCGGYEPIQKAQYTLMRFIYLIYSISFSIFSILTRISNKAVESQRHLTKET